MQKLGQKKIRSFRSQLLHWHDQDNNRELPWKEEKNPYFIWLSEIILQQTRVNQGLSYFNRFKELFPTVTDLANATEDEVLNAWEGLGYYSRARNLHASAKYVVNDLKGEFPHTYNEILKLKGVGSYTAAAIASFAFDEVQAVVDGNVIRVLARYLGIYEPFKSAQQKRLFAETAQQLIDVDNPALYNQAIMDFGATVCSPQKPLCADCVLSEGCYANKHQEQHKLPTPLPAIKKQHRYFNYIVYISEKQETHIRKRPDADVWKGLYEFPLIEEEKLLAINQLLEKLGITVEVQETFDYKQTLSHQIIHSRFFILSTPTLPNSIPEENMQSVSLKNIHLYPFPKTVCVFLEKYFK